MKNISINLLKRNLIKKEINFDFYQIFFSKIDLFTHISQLIVTFKTQEEIARLV